MILKLLGSIILFIIAIVEKYWSKEISKNKYIKRGFLVLLILSLLFSAFTIILDDIETNISLKKQEDVQAELIRKNDSLKIQLDSLLKVINNSEKNSGDRSLILQSKISEVKDKLEPFIKLAVKKYPNLKIDEALEKLQNEIIETKKLAQPNAIRFHKKEVTQNTDGYTLKLFFITTKNEPLGTIAIGVSILGLNLSVIQDIWPHLDGGAFSTGPDSKLITSNGKQARIIYSLIGMGRPVIEIKVSAKCKFRVEGNNDLPTFDIEM
ncbi:MAG: hypothetical protein WDA22_17180 [Bacteroidota bacterium]